MMQQTFRLGALAGLLALAACHSREPEPQPSETPSPPQAPLPAPSPAGQASAPAGLPSPAATPEASPSAAPPPALDPSALNERKDPARVLRFYADALAARDWAAAARAWGKGSGVTAATLKASYDRAQAPRLTIAKGEQDAGAGSLFYEAPVTLRFGPEGTAQRGTLSLRRVNDVDGASADQLRWHIERSTIGAGQ